MRRRLVRCLAELAAFPVENLVIPGTPDIFYTKGCIECKYVKAWPKEIKTPLRIPTFTNQQRIFLKRWCGHGGQAYFMIQIGQEWLLFWGMVAATVVGSLPRAEMYNQALRVWKTVADMEKEILECLSRN